MQRPVSLPKTEQPASTFGWGLFYYVETEQIVLYNELNEIRGGG